VCIYAALPAQADRALPPTGTFCDALHEPLANPRATFASSFPAVHLRCTAAHMQVLAIAENSGIWANFKDPAGPFRSLQFRSVPLQSLQFLLHAQLTAHAADAGIFREAFSL
jgi:hypothetical protein